MVEATVEKLARSEFSYLADCRGRVEVVPGDGRPGRANPTPAEVVGSDQAGGLQIWDTAGVGVTWNVS